MAGTENLTAKGQCKVAVLEILAGEGGGVGFFLQAIGVFQAVACEVDDAGAQLHDKAVWSVANVAGLGGLRG